MHPEVTVEVFRAGTGDLTTRVATEQASGGVQADVFLAADAGTFEDYAADELLLQYSPADVESLNQDIVDPEGYYTGTRIIPTVIAYNTALVTEPPTSWAELTDAEYANKLVMPNPDVSGAAAYNAAVWLDEPALGEEWLTKLAANKPVIADSNGPVSQAIATGAQPVGIVVDYPRASSQPRAHPSPSPTRRRACRTCRSPSGSSRTPRKRMLRRRSSTSS